MQKGFLAPCLFTLASVSLPFLKGAALTPSRHAQESASVPEPYVRVTSVTVEPSALHKTQTPSEATVTAQILLRGQAPPKSQAMLEVGTSSSDPPNNELKFENPTRTVPLQKGVTVVKFKAEIAPKTFQGKIKVAVTIGGATKGINVKDSEPKDYIAELAVFDH